MSHDVSSGVQFLSGGRWRVDIPLLSGGISDFAPQSIRNDQMQDSRSYGWLQHGVLSNVYGQYSDDLNTNLTAVRTTFSGKHKTYAMEATAIYDALTTSAALLSGLTSNTAGGSFATMANFDIMVNGTDMKKTTDGSTWTDLTAGATDAAPAGLQYIAAYNNRLFGCGHSGGIIRWSDVNAPAEWPTANSWDLVLRDDESYTGLKVWNDLLFAFSNEGAYVLQGFEQIRVVDYVENASCTSHRSIQTQPEFMAWWGRNGLMMMRNSGQGFSPPFEPWRNKYALIRDRDRSNDANVWSSWYPHERILFYYFAASGGNKAFLYYNPDSEGFFTSSVGTGGNFANEGGGSVRMSDGQLCHMSYSGGIGGWLGGTLSEADDSTRYMITKEFAPGGRVAVDTVSVLGQGGVVGEGNYLTVSLQLNGSDADNLSRSSTWNSAGKLDWEDFHFNVECRSFAVKVADVGKGTNDLASIVVTGQVVGG